MSIRTVISDLPKEEALALLVRDIRYKRDVPLALLPKLERIKTALVERLLVLGETRESLAEILAGHLPGVTKKLSPTAVLVGGTGRRVESDAYRCAA